MGGEKGTKRGDRVPFIRNWRFLVAAMIGAVAALAVSVGSPAASSPNTVTKTTVPTTTTTPQPGPGPGGGHRKSIVLARVRRVHSRTYTVRPGAERGASAVCPFGYVVVGTGYDANGGRILSVKSYGRTVRGFDSNDGTSAVRFSLQAICAKKRHLG
jgi:hypothetical protein